MGKSIKKRLAESVPASTQQAGQEDDIMLAIFTRELLRLNEISMEQPLDKEQLQRLEVLTRSLKQYTRQEQTAAPSPLTELTIDELRQLLTVAGEAQ